MKVVVTGGSGFIGSYLIKDLVEKGYTVSNIDLKVGKDIRSREDCVDSFKDAEAIIHLAALVDVQESIKYPYLYSNTNVDGTLNLLWYSDFYKLKRFVYISSAAVKDPTSPYGIQKLSSELYCNFYRGSLGLSTVILRPYNVYGRGNGKGVIDIWSNLIDEGIRPRVFGGSQTRDFVYIEDVVSAIVTSLESSLVGTYEIGTGIGTTMKDLCNLIISLKKSKLKPLLDKSQTGEVFYSRCERKDFDYKYSLEQGLKKYLES